jgi:hypothetical protein
MKDDMTWVDCFDTLKPIKIIRLSLSPTMATARCWLQLLRTGRVFFQMPFIDRPFIDMPLT